MTKAEGMKIIRIIDPKNNKKEFQSSKFEIRESARTVSMERKAAGVEFTVEYRTD